MENELGVPPDIREQLEKKEARAAATSPGGVGGRARGNASTAHQREVAMGRSEDEPEPEAEPEAPEEKKADASCPEPRCGIKVDSGWAYCVKCGTDLVVGGAAKRLGITLTDEDIQDYLFKGYVVRDIKLIGNHTVTMRTSQAKDLKVIDNHIVNGEWQKDKEGNEIQVSDFLLRQMNALCVTALAISKVDGKSIGETLEKKVEWMEEMGSAFVDMLAQRVTLFNRAITEYLKKEDALMGS